MKAFRGMVKFSAGSLSDSMIGNVWEKNGNKKE